ncbi:MAG: [FeFe] hydrogenase, group A [Planctomycetaceae bacterium]|jgi:ferredoxin hydrogenase|nr:[FeFe] hydrogenase, group A [Planctomycetaceae bacterium]
MTNDLPLTRREILKAAVKTGVAGGAVGTVLPLVSSRPSRAAPQMQGRPPAEPVYNGWIAAGIPGAGKPLDVRSSNPAIELNIDSCLACGNCSDFCAHVTTVYGRSVPKDEDACIYCGQCTFVCPNDLISEKPHDRDVRRAIADAEKIVVCSTAPAIRVALGELFRMTPGSNVEGKIVQGLKQLGADYVLDATFSADVTTVEEASELLERLEKKEKLPLVTSCCPAWIRFAKLFYPKLLPHISSVKSPIMNQGALVKTYFAEKKKMDPSKIFHVAITPCTAKKAEILLPNMNAAGGVQNHSEQRDVDAVLTCRELGAMFLKEGIQLPKLKDAAYDSAMGKGSGAAMIFGNTGGVAEAAMRTAFQLLNREPPPKDFYELKPVRGYGVVRQATVDLGKRKLNVAIVHGIGRVRTLLEAIQNGETPFDFVEVMACPGGCIGGGGQPRSVMMNDGQLKVLRLKALYQRDVQNDVRTSLENPEVKALYDSFLEKPLGERSKKFLHWEQ